MTDQKPSEQAMRAMLAEIINLHWNDKWTAETILECSNVPICYALEAMRSAVAPQLQRQDIYSDEVHSLADFRRWLMNRQQPPHAGTDTIGWLNPKEVLEKFDTAQEPQRQDGEGELARLREALETKGLAQAWRDGFMAAKETVASFRTTAHHYRWDQTRDALVSILERASQSQRKHSLASRPAAVVDDAAVERAAISFAAVAPLCSTSKLREITRAALLAAFPPTQKGAP